MDTLQNCRYEALNNHKDIVSWLSYKITSLQGGNLKFDSFNQELFKINNSNPVYKFESIPRL